MQSSVQESAARAVAPDAESQAAVRRYLSFASGSEYCAANIAAIREIIEVPALTPVPMVASVVRGVINLRGAVVPVIDLAERFGLGRTEIGRRSCVVVMEFGEGRLRQLMGVLVDAVHEVVDVTPADVEPVPELGTRIRPEHLEGMAKVGGRLITLLDLERVPSVDDLARQVSARAPH